MTVIGEVQVFKIKLLRLIVLQLFDDLLDILRRKLLVIVG